MPNAISRFGRTAAPVFTTVLLILILWISGFTVRPIEGIDEYFARIRASMDAIPYRIGDWVGKDMDPVPAATILLKPNKILQRSYLDTTTQNEVYLLFVHCGDVRDLGGHYPPVCYPNQGWQIRSSEPAVVQINGVQYAAQQYELLKSTGTDQMRMHILNFFILPTEEGSITGDMSRIRAAAERAGAAGLGAGQVQIISSRLSGEQRVAATKSMVDAITPAILEIIRGAEAG